MKDNLKRIINEYGFKIEKKVLDDGLYYYLCKNKQSCSSFILDFFYFDSGIEIDYNSSEYTTYANNLEVLYFLDLSSQSAEKINDLVLDENMSNNFLIYDENEDIEFIMKDLWNFIVKIL